MEIKTHQKINKSLCGRPVEVEDDKFASVELHTTKEMAVDEKGLIHGGFIFGSADYCAMLAVNHPNVVLGSADIKFLKPTKVGEILYFEGVVVSKEGKKRLVEVIGKNQRDEIVFQGNFICFVLNKHVLD
jgi:acyl-coenzyme A thioesterase PaaI-like protein